MISPEPLARCRSSKNSFAQKALLQTTLWQAAQASMLTMLPFLVPACNNTSPCWKRINTCHTPRPGASVSIDCHRGRRPLGTIRQSYLRRMMESASGSARFMFTTHTPSRVIEALRSRTQHIRLPPPSRKEIEGRLATIVEEEQMESQGAFLVMSHISPTETSARRSLSQNCSATGQCLATGKTCNT